MIYIDRIHFGRALKISEEESEPEPLYMESFYLCFIIYLGGLITAGFVFVYEICRNKKKSNFVTEIRNIKRKKTIIKLSKKIGFNKRF